MSEIILKGHKVAKGKAEGEALVSQTPISFMGGVDPDNGVVVEKGHELEGVCVGGKILVFPYGKGSTGGSYKLYELTFSNNAPKAIINLRADPIVALGAVLGNIPMVDRLEPSPMEVIKTGDSVIVDAGKGLVTVRKSN